MAFTHFQVSVTHVTKKTAGFNNTLHTRDLLCKPRYVWPPPGNSDLLRQQHMFTKTEHIELVTKNTFNELSKVKYTPSSLIKFNKNRKLRACVPGPRGMQPKWHSEEAPPCQVDLFEIKNDP